MTCARCGNLLTGLVQRLVTGWEGRQLAIQRRLWYCADVEVCMGRKTRSQSA